ncbi:MAG: 6-carboxytetrahydropterin synthase [Lachnospiraceae bacterium]|nr:6-carboxytetrahydropterin synthase [Lachnospiraceae bacterium]
MRYQQYRFKFYLDTNHSIVINGNVGQKHPHTWEIQLYILKIKEGFSRFDLLEKKIEAYFSKYQEKYINDVPPFNEINPTLENCCDVFIKDLSSILNAEGWVLLMVEMSETPTKSYVVNLLDNEDTEEEQISETISTNIIGRMQEYIDKRIEAGELPDKTAEDVVEIEENSLQSDKESTGESSIASNKELNEEGSIASNKELNEEGSTKTIKESKEESSIEANKERNIKSNEECNEARKIYGEESEQKADLDFLDNLNKMTFKN